MELWTGEFKLMIQSLFSTEFEMDWTLNTWTEGQFELPPPANPLPPPSTPEPPKRPGTTGTGTIGAIGGMIGKIGIKPPPPPAPPAATAGATGSASGGEAAGTSSGEDRITMEGGGLPEEMVTGFNGDPGELTGDIGEAKMKIGGGVGLLGVWVTSLANGGSGGDAETDSSLPTMISGPG